MRALFWTAWVSSFFILAPALAEQLNVIIVTEIRDISALSVQVGMKSTQTITIDTSNKSIKSEFKTGVTNVGVTTVNSVRDDFTASGVFTDGKVSLAAKGQTASAVSIFGDIDYSFDLSLDSAAKTVSIKGCHNAFPSYYVKVGDKKIYDREQTGTAVFSLVGSCDIKVDQGQISY